MAQELCYESRCSIDPILGASKLMVQAGGHQLLNICLQMFYLKPLSKLLPFLFVFSLQEPAKFESLLKEGHGAEACRIPGMPAGLKQRCQVWQPPCRAAAERATPRRNWERVLCVCVCAFPAQQS